MNYERKVSDLESELRSAHTSTYKYQEEVASQSDRIVLLKTEMIEKEKAIELLDEEVKVSSLSLSQLTKELDALRASHAALSQENSQLLSKTSSTEKSMHKEVNRLETELNEAMKKGEREREEAAEKLKLQVDQMAELRKEMDRLRLLSSESESSIHSTYKQHIAALNEERAKIQTAHDEKVTELTESHEDRVHALEASLTESHLRYEQVKKDSEKKMKEVTAEKAALQDQLKRYREEGESSQSEVATLIGKIKTLTEELNSMKKNAEETGSTLQQQLVSSQERERELKDKISSLSSSQKESQNEIDALKREVVSHLEAIEKVKKELAEAAVEEKESLLASTSKDLAALRKSIQDKESAWNKEQTKLVAERDEKVSVSAFAVGTK